MKEKHYECRGCGKLTFHAHMHDTAHGIAETHMVGTERFVCKDCLFMTFARDEGAERFPFVFDVPPKKGVPVQ